MIDGRASFPNGRSRFLERQFHAPSSHWQKAFDSCFGVLSPVLCLVFDPCFFRGSAGGSGLFSERRVYAYTEIFVGVLAMSYIIFAGRASSFIRGVLFGTGAFAVLLGLVLTPFSVASIAMRFWLGVFGLILFAPGFVLFRNAIRHDSHLPNCAPLHKGIAVLTAVSVFVLPAVPDILAASMVQSVAPGV
jgi:hypothetical protein